MNPPCPSSGPLGRLNPRGDVHYMRLLRWDAEARLLVQRQLRMLAAHHQGRHHDFTRIRDRYLSRIIRYARKYSPLHSERLAVLGDGRTWSSAAWAEVPLLDKATIRGHRERLVATPADCPWTGELTTGGSTGEPFGFPYLGGHDAEHQEFLWRLHGYRPGDRILAMDGSLVDEAAVASGIYWTKKADQELPYGGTSLSGHYLNGATADAYLGFLADRRPEFIRGYPSLVAEVASYAKARGIRLPCKAVELSSESHTDEQVSLIEDVFGPVFDQYGHAEASIFAYSLSARGQLFCSPLYGLVEVLDDAGEHVKVGETGEVVVTGFHNYAMPFIRYRTGDLAVYDGESHGIVRLRAVLGRTQDYLLSADGEKHLLTALVFGRHYAAMARIDRWQLVQDEPGTAVIRIDRGEGYGPGDEAEIRRNFMELAGIDTVFDYESGIDRSGRAKAPWVIQRAVRPGAS